MLDLKTFRDDPEGFRERIGRKKFDVDWDGLMACDQERRQKVTQVEALRAQRNTSSQAMAQLDKNSEAFKAQRETLQTLSAQAKELEKELQALEERWEALWLSVPNCPDASVPTGSSEEDNQVVHTWGDPGSISEDAKPHYDLPNFERWIDFPRGSKVTGAGFPFYRGDMARLVRALVTFFLEEARKAGFQELMTPLLVNAKSAMATGQLPDKEGMMYTAQADGLYAIPTAEVSVTNFFRDETLETLPLYACAHTPCFRREAGSWGADVRGLNRLHQFDKVELVKWVQPEHGEAELESLRAYVGGLLEKLELPYRTLLMCSGDIGFAHAKQYDFEVWAGGQKRWLEVSSCSWFTDFQARRARIRCRDSVGRSTYAHTLNASGLALPRTLAALLENNATPDGRVPLPKILEAYSL